MLTTEIQLRKLVRSLWRMGGRAFFQTKLPQWICRRGAVGLPISFTSRTPERSFRRTYFWGPQVPSLQDIANLQFHHKQPARPKKKSRSCSGCIHTDEYCCRILQYTCPESPERRGLVTKPSSKVLSWKECVQQAHFWHTVHTWLLLVLQFQWVVLPNLQACGKTSVVVGLFARRNGAVRRKVNHTNVHIE